jgi:hypothetical protein
MFSVLAVSQVAYMLQVVNMWLENYMVTIRLVIGKTYLVLVLVAAFLAWSGFGSEVLGLVFEEVIKFHKLARTGRIAFIIGSIFRFVPILDGDLVQNGYEGIEYSS